MVLGGVLYGLSFGVLLPCLLLGAAGHLTWQLASHRLAPLLSKASSVTRVTLWIGLQIMTVPISLWLTFVAYVLPWLFLGGR